MNIAKSALSILVIALMASGEARAEELTGTLKKIRDSGVITLGHRSVSRPFSFVDERGLPAGYSIDLCAKVVDAVKEKLALDDLAVEYVLLAPEERLPKVADGTVDLECGNTTNTLSRQETVDFSNMTFITGASLLALAKAGIATLDDLAGKKVGVSVGTTTESSLRESLNKRGVKAEVIVVDGHDDGMRMLAAGEIDAYAGDQIVLTGLARESEMRDQLQLARELFSYEPYGLVMRRGDPDFRLVVNRALARTYRQDGIAEIYGKWFGDWGGRPSQLLLAMYALNALPE